MDQFVFNINGRILPLAEATASVLDRSYLYGDSLYEVVRTYHGRPFGLNEHLARLEQSAAKAHMTLHQTSADYAREIEKTLQAYRAQFHGPAPEAYCRLVVSRGTGRIGFGLQNLRTPSQFSIIVFPAKTFSQEEWEKGLRLAVATRYRNHPRALDPAMKSGNYLNSLLAYLEEVDLRPDAGFDDAILCTEHGDVTEGTTFNIGYLKRGIFVTPPLDIGILDGITRRLVLKVCAELEIPVREVRFPKERLYEADEVVATSSLKEIFPVVRVDRHTIGDGRPGPLTRKMAAALKRHLPQRGPTP